ncbi:putative O-antigen ligase [Vibrio coralliirubri]|uniref:O-antigen ligase family protein n=1 Tax=Vibrio coralliirubri TaxID=1516159 RepID=UPI000630AAFC|nr:O-antigen ligase family protein [Vibrio coralliirubri]CDT99859.1 putative O-antigen ligase [Vibrio coralliirubri]
MAVFLLISSSISLLLNKINKLDMKKQLCEPYLLIIVIATLYSILSYYYHGASSREMRALIVTSLFLGCLYFQREHKDVLAIAILVGSLTVFSNSLYFHMFLGEGRHIGYINPIPYSTICAVIGVVSYAFFLINANIAKKIIFLLSFILSIYPLIISQSRGVWLAFIVGLTITSLIYLKSNKLSKKGIIGFILITFAISSIGGYVLKDNISDRVNKTLWELSKIESGNLKSSIGLRLQMWSVTPKLIKENLIIGSGDKHQLIIEDLYKNGEITKSLYKFNPTHYHNQFLDKLVKSGVIGFFIFICIIVHPLTLIRRLSKNNKLIVYGVLSIYITASLSDVPFNHPQTLIIFLLILLPLCSKEANKNHD